MKNPTILIILDGWGEAPASKANAISLAKTPFFDMARKKYPFTLLDATGEAVGLDGNRRSGSEAGHNNIGAGRIVPQEVRIINSNIKSGRFFRNSVLIDAMRNCQTKKSSLHLMGLMGSKDSPHSDCRHFKAVLRLAKERGIKNVYCHLFTDGRDSYPQTALQYLKKYQSIIKEEKIGRIATISGRFWAMDRSKNWSRLQKAYQAMVFAKGEMASSPQEAIKNSYKKKLFDEHILPTVVLRKNKQPVAKINNNDSIIFFNLRSDRARQFTKLFVPMEKKKIVSDKMLIIKKRDGLYFVALTDFGPDLNIHTAFPDMPLRGTLPIALEKQRQLYITETEKFAHITYFFNGGYADAVAGEEQIKIPSLTLDSYAKRPEMSAGAITEVVVDSLKKNKYDFITINFANSDMVAHTGDLKATVQAVEFVDQQIKKITKEALKKNGKIIITADHGNADDMLDEISGQEIPNTFHTKNPVPFMIIDNKHQYDYLSSGGVLANIAPTILDIMKVRKPEEMEEDSLLVGGLVNWLTG